MGSNIEVTKMNIDVMVGILTTISLIIGIIKVFKKKKSEPIKHEEMTFIKADKNSGNVNAQKQVLGDVITNITNITNSQTLHKEEKKYDFFNVEAMKDYKNNIESKYGEIKFFGVHMPVNIKKERKSLIKMYVKPILKIKDLKEKKVILESESFIFNDKSECYLTVENLLEDKFSNKIVILGNPGFGKSTLIKYMMCKIVENNKVEKIPITIEIKKMTTQNLTIEEYIKNTLNEEYNLKIEMSQLEKLILQNKVIIFFDGLDEIFDNKIRCEIKNKIEIFSKKHKDLRIIITSRIVGYNEIKFDENIFEIVEIQKFDEERLQDYVKKWFQCEILCLNECEEQIKKFNIAIKKINPELKYNPLLLTLILMLYSNNGEIPKTILDIYRSCTKTLVSSWDKEKNIKLKIDDKIEEKKEVIFMKLAYWQYRFENKSKFGKRKAVNIGYSQVKSEIEKILLEEKLALEHTKSEKAEEFLEYISKREIYIENDFTHKTFLEFYTALYIASTLANKAKERENLMEFIKDKIGQSYWYIVIDLIFKMEDERYIDCEVMDEMIDLIIADKRIGKSGLENLVKIIYPLQHLSEEKKEKAYMEYLKNKISDRESLELFDLEENICFLSALNKIYKDLKTSIEKKIYYHIFLERAPYEDLTDKQKKEYDKYKKQSIELFIQDKLNSNKKIDFNCIEELKINFGEKCIYESTQELYRNISRIAPLSLAIANLEIKECCEFLKKELTKEKYPLLVVPNIIFIPRRGLKEEEIEHIQKEFMQAIKKEKWDIKKQIFKDILFDLCVDI